MSGVSIIRKNASEEIRVELSKYNDHDLVNVRIWADARTGGGDRVPTKAGIACRVALLPALIEALIIVASEARAKGLLPAAPAEDPRLMSDVVAGWLAGDRHD